MHTVNVQNFVYITPQKKHGKMFWIFFCFFFYYYFFFIIIIFFFQKHLVELRTVQTLIRLLLKEQSDLDLHCLPIIFVQDNGVVNFRTFTVYQQKVINQTACVNTQERDFNSHNSTVSGLRTNSDWLSNLCKVKEKYLFSFICLGIYFLAVDKIKRFFFYIRVDYFLYEALFNLPPNPIPPTIFLPPNPLPQPPFLKKVKYEPF